MEKKYFEILRPRFHGVRLIQEKELRSPICWLLEYDQYLIEAAAAVACASSLFGHIRPIGSKVIVPMRR